jgi:FtsZ-binding cell division protein ZapB
MLDTFELDHNIFSNNAEADKALAVKFFIAPVRNEEKSAKEGRPIFDDTEMVEIRVRGDRNNIPVRPARPEDKQRFRDAYRAFKDGHTNPQSGTPLAEWPLMSVSMVEELKYLGFHTVEQIAEAQETALNRVMGLRQLKDKAKHFMELAKGNSPITELEKQNQELRDQLKASQEMMAKLSAKVDELVSKADAPAAVRK